jgi:DNA polymerase-3 subunit epsilon
MIITVIDTETTGLDLIEHELLELAILKVKIYENRTKVLDRYVTKVKPQFIERANPIALKVNGYTKKAWQNAPLFCEVASEVREYIEQCDYHIGQNLIFDYRFIAKAYNQCGLESPQFKEYYDTKSMADVLVSSGIVKKSGLDFLCEHFKIKTQGRAHTALTDVRRTFELYKKISKKTEPRLFSFSSPYDPYGGKNAKEKEIKIS